jgi:DNA-binding CsgD family transcriptional regulator
MNESGQSSRGRLAILGAWLIVLPWILFSLGRWGLYLYLLLGFAFAVIMVCLNYRELRGQTQSCSAPSGRSAAYQHILTARELEIVSKARAKHSNEETAKESFGLTYRELHIVTAIVAGYSDKEIARYDKIGEQTVEHCVNSIFRKLRVSTRLDLALFAVNHSLLLKKAT